jgi:thiol:disulfide interchange protein DsbA
MNNSLKNLYKLFLICFLSISVSAEYELGRDYRLVDSPLPVKRDGVVEVTESFWYGCAHCYSFEPAINNWKSKLSDDVKFSKMPITWGGIHQLHASLYYTIDALKLDPSTHSAVFVTIHKEGNFLQNPKAIQKFLSNFGVAPEVTSSYLNSFGVKQKVNKGIKYARQLKVASVPMVIVDGTYVIESKRSFEEMLKVVDHVIELQRPNS